jgi:hypothetical protein
VPLNAAAQAKAVHHCASISFWSRFLLAPYFDHCKVHGALSVLISNVFILLSGACTIARPISIGFQSVLLATAMDSRYWVKVHLTGGGV